MREIAANVKLYEDVSYEKLEQTWGSQWPTNGSKPRLAPLPPIEFPPDSDYPFRLIASRINYHQQTGTMSVRVGVLAREYPETFAELSEGDAQKLGLRPGSLIRISSKSGSLTRRMVLNDEIPNGCVNVPHFFGGDSPNALASYECDPDSGVPTYKTCAVKIEAVK